VDDVIPAGDVDVGDVIVLPDADDPVLVSMVRLGREGSSSTVTPLVAARPRRRAPLKLTAQVRLCKRGRDMAG